MNPAAAPRFAEVPPGATGLLVIDLKTLVENYELLKKTAHPAEAAAVVKANAYGLGAEVVVAALAKAGARTFFVATLQEAIALRVAQPQAVIYVLDGLLPQTAPLFQVQGLRPVLNSVPELEEWAAHCEAQGMKLPAAVHVDTGMKRLGLAQFESASAAKLAAAFDLALLMTHLACADEPSHPLNERQLSRFQEAAAHFPSTRRSIANSAGVFLGQAYHADLVRPGVALYGARPMNEGANPMRPVVSLYGRIAQLHWAEPGESVGYGAGHIVKRRTRIATVTVGYADGYLRHLSASDRREGPPAFIGEHRLPLLGRVSMDLTTFDATDVPEALLERGGWVELLGPSFTVDDLAQCAGTIGYEILTSLGRRYHRVYVNG